MTDIMPFIIYQQGTMNELYHWVLQPNGLRIGPMTTYTEAEVVALRLKQDGQLPKQGEPALPAPTHVYYVDSDGLNQPWRWRHEIGAGPHQRAEYTKDNGDFWQSSGHTVGELTGETHNCGFTCLGNEPRWA